MLTFLVGLCGLASEWKSIGLRWPGDFKQSRGHINGVEGDGDTFAPTHLHLKTVHVLSEHIFHGPLSVRPEEMHQELAYSHYVIYPYRRFHFILHQIYTTVKGKCQML